MNDKYLTSPPQTLVLSGALFNPKKKNMYIKKAWMGTHHKMYKATKEPTIMGTPLIH
jgi:hypothetical protein